MNRIFKLTFALMTVFFVSCSDIQKKSTISITVPDLNSRSADDADFINADSKGTLTVTGDNGYKLQKDVAYSESLSLEVESGATYTVTLRIKTTPDASSTVYYSGTGSVYAEADKTNTLEITLTKEGGLTQAEKPTIYGSQTEVKSVTFTDANTPVSTQFDCSVKLENSIDIDDGVYFYWTVLSDFSNLTETVAQYNTTNIDVSNFEFVDQQSDNIYTCTKNIDVPYSTNAYTYYICIIITYDSQKDKKYSEPEYKMVSVSTTLSQ